jgi:type IV secretion system protein VirD4
MFGVAKWYGRALVAKSVYSWWRERNRHDENRGRFLPSGEMRDLLSSRHHGLLIDGHEARLNEDASFRNLAIVAPTGTGKTSTFIIPNLLSLDRCSIVATDPSGALFAKTSGDLERRGYRVLKLDPTDLARSIGFNPLARAKTFSEMQEIAHILIRTSNAGTKPDPFWVAGAEEIVSILIKCLKRHPDAENCANLANVQHLLHGFGTGQGLLPFVAACAPDSQTYHAFRGFISQPDKTMQGMVSQAKTALTILSDPDVARLTARSSFDFGELRKRKTALFLTYPQNKTSYYSILANLFYAGLFHACLDDSTLLKSDLPIFGLLDEFGHMQIPDFPAIITTTRQRRVSLSLVLQSMSQLEERYGHHGAQTIFAGGVTSALYFPGMDIDTASKLSRTLGETVYERVGERGQIIREREPLMSPAALRSMPDNQMLYLYANKRPMILNAVPYYESRTMKRRAELPAARSEGGVVDRVQYIET